MSISKAFTTFIQDAPAHADAWMQAVKALDEASALDKKTEELAYIAVLAATGNISGVPFHVHSARSHGASRQEVLSAVLIGLPAVGSTVIAALSPALEAYDEKAQ
ncbi:carboxymuconolactone decarboxylase family protein [Pseudomonas sp. QD4]|uniref:carboxymuconolactone decarboxylase family protein n=1 Tax=Pseudomonas sp. QD4 TaxID=3368618 RepID=UPI003BA3A8C6